MRTLKIISQVQNNSKPLAKDIGYGCCILEFKYCSMTFFTSFDSEQNMDKEQFIYVKSVKSYFVNHKGPSYKATLVDKVLTTTWESQNIDSGLGTGVVSKTSPRFLFGEQKWTDGIFFVYKSAYWDFMDLNLDNRGKLVSVIPNLNKRIIINRIEIKLTPNIIKEHKHFLMFSLLKVKRTIHTANVGARNNLDNNDFIASDDLQLVKKGCFFSTEKVIMKDLNYEVTKDDDLLLIQKVEINPKQTVGLRTKPSNQTLNKADGDKDCGYATSYYSHYEIVIHYSFGVI